jgi:hypothetical protein
VWGADVFELAKGGIEVAEILNHRFFRRKLQYLVRWVGYGPEHNSWLDAPELEEVKALDDYEATSYVMIGGSCNSTFGNRRRRKGPHVYWGIAS